ncbi:hypothetical protein GCM10009751_34610 [Myceligenerans crystallogenes]|uniref:Signal peptidase I n=2 Tax=Myceligenerans crystallogenes TaxID=316335 RepID=A0ABP4ZX87_9MICO
MADDQGPSEEKSQSRGLAILKETLVIVVSALLLSFLIKTFLMQPFSIPSASMQDTLTMGDRVMVSRLAPGPVDLQRGDVVVFVDPGGWLDPYPFEADRGAVGNAITAALTTVGLLPEDMGEHLIKRVIGLPGDHVVCDDACANDGGPLHVNGVAVTETYIKPGTTPSSGKPFDVTVPEDSLWVMGDNRQSSADSRYNTEEPGGGFVPVDNVVGAAFATVWPLDRLTWHSNPSAVFQDVPAAGAAAS